MPHRLLITIKYSFAHESVTIGKTNKACRVRGVKDGVYSHSMFYLKIIALRLSGSVHKNKVREIFYLFRKSSFIHDLKFTIDLTPGFFHRLRFNARL